ncbi:MAG: winged helix-turn-helix domain-containing protein [Acidimicrobiales bacterium]
MSLAAARRIALGAQGFTDKRPTGTVTARHFQRALDRMTILQLDSVNVVSRTHYLPMLARLGPYEHERLDRFLYRSGKNFEYMSHEASITSQELQPFLRWRMGKAHWKRAEELEQNHRGYLEAVLDEIAERGPLTIKQLSDPGERTGPWWGRSKGKIALDWLYYTGRLAIAGRDNMFVTAYDIPERVIRPEILAAPTPTDAEAARHLLLLGARSHGIGTATDIADYFRLKMPVARPILAELVADGSLEPVEVEGWPEPAFLHPEATRPRNISGRALLSPFDPVVWFRPRAERLFGFHYRIEIYVPAEKRVHGYYVLPFLLDGDLVGRVDLKADRAARVLRVRGSFAEPGVDLDQVAASLAEALTEMAAWLGLDGVDVEPNGDHAPHLAHACR